MGARVARGGRARRRGACGRDCGGRGDRRRAADRAARTEPAAVGGARSDRVRRRGLLRRSGGDPPRGREDELRRAHALRRLLRRQRDRAAGGRLLLGAVGNGLIVALWAVDRIWGLPLGPEHWKPDPVGFGDSAASAFELLLVTGWL